MFHKLTSITSTSQLLPKVCSAHSLHICRDRADWTSQGEQMEESASLAPEKDPLVGPGAGEQPGELIKDWEDTWFR